MKALKAKLAKPDIQFWPEVRWWLAEGFNTDKTLKKDIQMLFEAGFGGAEFLAMDEPGAGSQRYGWGSEEWVHDSQVVLEETTARGMAVSMTSGTNWSNANLITIQPDDRAAAKELDYTSETVAAGATRSGALAKPALRMPNIHVQELIAVVAARRSAGAGAKPRLSVEGLLVLTGQVEAGALTWTAPAGSDYELIALWMHGTGQTASPSAGISYTVNYIDRYGVDALIDYWNREVLTPHVRETIQQNGRAQMYMDSLELSTFGQGGQFWGYHLLEEFQRRRGYDLTPYLPFILKKGGGMMQVLPNYRYDNDDPALLEKVRNDLHATFTDLYMENMLKPIQEWLHSVDMQVRAEISYGMPFEISQPGKYVDGIETESLEFSSQIDSYRGLAGAAHLYNRLYSSETGATLANYKHSLDFYNQIIFTQFAAGVSRTVLHGYSSIAGTEQATQWPGHEGMWPMFSERFGSRQPAYQHYNDWTDMLARFQMLLRQGKPRMDLGILRLDYNFNNLVFGGGSEDDLYEKQYMRANQGMYWKDPALQNAGYTYDYFAPQILEDETIAFADGEIAPDGPGYQALVIYQEVLPLSSAKQILAWAKQGLPVLIANGVTEMIRTGVDKTHPKAAAMTPNNDGLDGELAQVMAELKALPNVAEIDGTAGALHALQALGVAPRAKFSEPNKKILTLLRADGDLRYLYAYHYMYPETEPFTFKVAVEGVGKPYAIDCWKGTMAEIGLYEHVDGRTLVELTLQPGEATMLAINLAEKDSLHAVESQASQVLVKDGKLVVVASKSGTYSTRLSSGAVVTKAIAVPEPVELALWDLEVEDWDAGDRVVIAEDRGLGYVTREVHFETRKTRIPVGMTELKPWKDIPAVGEEVSGVGYYTTTFSLPEGWGAHNGALLKLGSTHGSTAAVYVNGKKAGGVDIENPVVDVSELLAPGENKVTVEVSSTLTNRLRARKYFEGIPQAMAAIFGLHQDLSGQGDPEAGAMMGNMMKMLTHSSVQDYGLTGAVTLIPYTVEEL